LGAIESLIEQRILADPKADPRMGALLSPLVPTLTELTVLFSLNVFLSFLVRISIGLEAFKDLKSDLIAGFAKVKALEL
jgi:hypothetical protein